MNLFKLNSKLAKEYKGYLFSDIPPNVIIGYINYLENKIKKLQGKND